LTVELTILADDKCSDENLRAEHGLAILVTGDSRSVLFDAGASGQTLQHNADALGIDLGSIATVVVSHGHYDHTGGLMHLAQQRRGLHIYAHPLAFSRRWSEVPGQPLKDISSPHPLEKLVDAGAVFHAVKAPEMIEPWMLLSGPIGGPRCGPDHFVIRRNDDIVPDWFQDELCLLLKARRGWIIVTGCCHRGLKNTLRCAGFLTHQEPIHAIVGGLHLHSHDNDALRDVMQVLGEFGNPGLYPCHCTGEQSTQFLAKRLGDQVHPIQAGRKLKF
jgi:7,8-dihydropterin-6-yl-methyl-4-(beta-D-ribofuranosyl)aminobenzene 5'-phosphate synthase